MAGWFAPSVSVVIPTRGRRRLLQATLASVTAQSRADWEAVIVDDRSTDDTPPFLAAAAAADARVRPMSVDPTATGANVARNRGLAAARGRYVVFLDSDDLLEPDCLARRVDRLDARPDLDFTVNAVRCFHRQPGDLDRAWNTMTDEDDFDRFLRLDGPWQTAAATWRRTSLDRVDPWSPAVLSLQDLDFHLRALAAGLRYEKVNAWDCHYRLPAGRPTVTADHRSPAHRRSHLLIARRLLDLPDVVLDATPLRRQLLAALCFLFARRCAESGHVAAAVDLWRAARRRGTIVRRRHFAEGLTMLATRGLPPPLPWAGRVAYDRWPAIDQVEFRHTLLHAPLPPRADA